MMAFIALVLFIVPVSITYAFMHAVRYLSGEFPSIEACLFVCALVFWGIIILGGGREDRPTTTPYLKKRKN